MTDSPIPQQLGFFGSDVDLSTSKPDHTDELAHISDLQEQRWQQDAAIMPLAARDLYLHYRHTKRHAKAQELLDDWTEVVNTEQTND